jgi:spore maturation protein CgeB
MGLNMSRGQYQKLYSSDRIASLIGNGLLTFMDQKTNYGKFFTNKEIVFYKNKDDLIKKILFFKKNEILAKKYAKNAYIKYHKYFNAKEVCSYILSECNLIKRKKFYWLK